MPKHPPCPQPPGAPRWVAMFHRPAEGSWTVGAESPDRAPVLYAVGDMTQTLRARGEEVTVALWGPENGAWHLFDAPAARETAPAPAASAGASAPGAGGPDRLTERMRGRRHQVLLAGLGKAGLYDLSDEDGVAVRAMAELLDEPTVRRVAHWLSAAAGER
ncbi:hypothetical protein [Streptomyces alanosinicus]|uniref:Uncharacterized protein n=1 Tax=Streptomyces alanosinicus TaxID=68171 RepID=A0A918YI79_9ACTN|nr:hypothetical protein [Streptomyces alanosinicus]GHE03870.1 hypothetical protein GCM10010339_33080 [Streptomyces alanosinicus]